MYLKYKKHKKIANLSLTCLFVYALLVFLILTRFCTVQYEIGEFSKICFFVFFVFLLVFLLSFTLDDVDKIFASSVYGKSIYSLRNSFILSFSFLFFMFVAFICFNNSTILNLFLLFLFMSICFLILCLLNKKTISRNNILLVYFLFYFIFLWPVLEQTIENITFFSKICKIIFWISPFLLMLFRTSIVDFLWSGNLIHRWFKIKDSEIRNCPWCHEYILKKPIRFCPHCWNDCWALDSGGNSLVHVCNNCGFFIKIKEIDFPNFCPHCGLWFKMKTNMKRLIKS